MGIWSWNRQDKPRGLPGGIGSECEAFLQGTYVEYLDSAGCIIPTWAWLNVLAHGTEDQVAALASCAACRYEAAARGTGWYSVTSLLAVEMLARVRATGRSVPEIQRSILVDLELALAQECVKRWPRPSEVVDRTLAALHGRPSDHY